MKQIAVYIVLGLWISHLMSFAQNPAKYVREGNKLYNREQYQDAEIHYRRAMQTENKWYNQALFNTGNALYKQQKYDEAIQFYNQLLARQQLTERQKAEIYHNIGNIGVMQQKYREAAEAYKNALRLNPDDEDTRYNLAWVLQKLQQHEQQHNQQNQQNQSNQQNQNQQENQNEQQQDNKQQKQDNQQQQQQQQKMSREEKERILRALAQQDRNIQQQLKEKERTVAPYKPEKDW